MALIRDERRDRWVREFLGEYEKIKEPEFEEYDLTDPVKYDDHELFIGRVREVVTCLENDPTTRRAIVTSNRESDCMVGIQVIARDQLHVFAWLRSSDVAEKRDDDIAFLITFGQAIRSYIEHRPIVLHIFTSSLHWEVDE